MAAGKTAAACNAFTESERLQPAASTLLNLGACLEKNEQLASAWGAFLEAERTTRSATDTTGQKMHDVASERATKLEPRLSHLTINAAHAIDGLEIVRNKDVVGTAALNHGLPVDGGKYTIRARAPHHREWSTTVTVATERDAKTVDIPELASEPVTAQPIEVTRTLPATSTQPERSLGLPIAVASGAVALLGCALAFDLWGDSTYDDASHELTDQKRRDSLYDSANTKRELTIGFATAGAVGAGVAVWLFVRHPERQTAVVPTATGVALVGRF